jgi:hypothetical protein
MGFYYQNDSAQSKTETLIEKHGAVVISPQRARDAIAEGVTAVMCVFKNGGREEAAYCYDRQELERLCVTDDDAAQTLLEVPNKVLIENLTEFTGSPMQAVKTKQHLYS